MQVLFFFRASDFPVFPFSKIGKNKNISFLSCIYGYGCILLIAVAALFPKEIRNQLFCGLPSFCEIVSAVRSSIATKVSLDSPQ